MDASIAFVRGLYQAFIEGRIETVIDGCAADVSWECVGNPVHVPHAGRFHGRDGVARFFDNLSRAYVFSLFSPDQLFAAGECVFCLGHANATAVASGLPIDTRFVHMFRLRDGCVAEFLEISDTAAIAIGAGRLQEAITPPAPTPAPPPTAP